MSSIPSGDPVFARALLGLSDAVIVAEAASGRVVLLNPAAERLFGRPAEQVVGQQLDLLETGWFRLAEGRHDVAARRGDGTELRVELCLGRLEEAEPPLVTTIARALPGAAPSSTAQRHLEFLSGAFALAAASLDYETTLASVARLAVPYLADWCTVYLRDDDGQIRRVAVACADPEQERLAEQLRRFAPSATSAHSRIGSVLASGRPELVEDIPDSYVDSIAQDAEHLEILRRLRFRSSIVVPLEARGGVLGAMAFFTAASGRRYGPGELNLAEELARCCALAVDNARLYREAQEAIRLREDVLAAVSHDLKGPLTAIIGQAQLLQRRSADPALFNPADLAGSLERIRRATERLGALVNELLDVAQLQAGQPLQLRLRPTDLIDLTQRAIHERQEANPRHRIRLETGLARLVGVWDRFRLERVLDNLLGNAVKYSPRGGEIVVTVAAEPEGPGPSTGWAVLTVRDRGVGIPPDDLPRVFERFHRGSNVARRTRGTGIGLAGARQIVAQHGGAIVVESREGAGSLFTVRLPLRPSQRAV